MNRVEQNLERRAETKWDAGGTLVGLLAGGAWTGLAINHATLGDSFDTIFGSAMASIFYFVAAVYAYSWHNRVG